MFGEGLTENPILRNFYDDLNQLIQVSEELQVQVLAKKIVNKDCRKEDMINLVVKVNTPIILQILEDSEIVPCKNLAAKIRGLWCEIVNILKKNYQDKYEIISESKFNISKQKCRKFQDAIVPNRISYKKHPSYKLTNKEYHAVSYENLISEIKQQERILIYGEAGIGKNFHFRSLLLEYFKDTKCTDHLILSVNLREINEEDQYEKVLFKQNFENSTKITYDLFCHCLSDDSFFASKKIVLFLYGADEIVNKKSSFYKIIYGKKNFSYKLVVWTRSSKLEELENIYDVILEVAGLNEENKETYFRKFFNEQKEDSTVSSESYYLKDKKENQKVNSQSQKNFEQYRSSEDCENYSDKLSKGQPSRSPVITSKSKDLIQTLKRKTPKFWELCKIPLFAELIGLVYNKNKNSLENAVSIIEEYVHHTFPQFSFEKTDETYIVCVLAYENLLNRQRLMKIDEKIWYSTNCFGGMATELSWEKDEISFKFNHKTFQEYFASKYIIKEMDDENNTKIRNDFKITENIRKLNNVLEFIYEIDPKTFKMISKINQHIPELFHDKEMLNVLNNVEKKDVLLTQNRRVTSSLLNYIGVHFPEDRLFKKLKFKKVSFDSIHFLNELFKYNLDSLTEIKVSHKYDHHEILYNSITEILENFKKLKSFCLKNVRISKENKRKKFSNILDKLEMINVENFPNLTFMGQRIGEINFSHSSIGEVLLSF